jgi:hypothetical protein
MSPWVPGKHLAQLLLVLLALPALAEPPVVDPKTGLALDPRVKGAEVCVVLPDALYEPEACAGVPRGDEKMIPQRDKSLHALAVLRRGEATVMLTVSSVTRPGIGEMSGRQIQGFVEAMVARLAEDFKAPPRLLGAGKRPYALMRTGEGVPVVGWEYTTDVPDLDPQANVASGLAFLVPSRDTLDIISFNCHQKELAVARELSAQVMATVKVPLTIDADSFGGRSWSDPGIMAALMGGVFLLLAAGGWLWWRRSASRG